MNGHDKRRSLPHLTEVPSQVDVSVRNIHQIGIRVTTCNNYLFWLTHDMVLEVKWDRCFFLLIFYPTEGVLVGSLQTDSNTEIFP